MSRLDQCNSSLCGISETSINRPQKSLKCGSMYDHKIQQVLSCGATSTCSPPAARALQNNVQELPTDDQGSPQTSTIVQHQHHKKVPTTVLPTHVSSHLNVIKYSAVMCLARPSRNYISQFNLWITHSLYVDEVITFVVSVSSRIIPTCRGL